MQEDALRAMAVHFFDLCLKEMQAKGADYSDRDIHEDALGNFKGSARDVGITALQTWFVHWDKHVRAIKRYVRTGGKVGSESIQGRLMDNANYSILLLALVRDLQAAGFSAAPPPPHK